MRTETVDIYRFEELEPHAQERAIERASSSGWYGDAWADEWRDTLKAAERALPIRVKDWTVDPWGLTDATIETTDEQLEDLSGVRAWKWIHNSGLADAIAKPCPWTGYCGDEAFLAPLRAFILRPDARFLGDLFQECGDAWARGWRDDIEYQMSDEAIGEDLTINEVEFTEDGDLYR